MKNKLLFTGILCAFMIVFTILSSYSATANYPASDGWSGALIQFHLNETTGNIADNTGTYGATGDGTTIGGDSAWVTGLYGNGYNSTGINTAGNKSIRGVSNISSDTSFTVAMWVKPDVEINITYPDANENEEFVFAGSNSGYADCDTGGQCYSIYWGATSGALKCSGYSGFIVTTSQIKWLKDEWYHIACVWNSTGGYVYVNGALDNFTTTGSPNSADLRYFKIGVRYGDGTPTNGRHFVGVIDEFHLLDYDLTAGNITDLYNGTTPSAPPPAVIPIAPAINLTALPFWNINYTQQSNITCSVNNTETTINLWRANITALDLQPNATAGKDNYMFNGVAGNINYGTETELIVGRAGDGTLMRGILEFNLSAIPSNAVITNARLILYATDGSASTTKISIYGLTNSWSELTSSWNARTTGTNWTIAGSDYNISISVNASIPQSSILSVLEFDVTELAQKMVSGDNYGFLIKTNETQLVDFKMFASSDNANAVNHPRLIIDYTLTPLTFIASSKGGQISNIATLPYRKYDYICNSTGTENYTAYRIAGTLNITKTCDENWLSNNTACGNYCGEWDKYLIGYYDNNTCGTFDDLPANNNTCGACNYCTLVTSQHNTSCTVYDNFTSYYTNDNKVACCDITNLSADCVLPANITYECNYCTAEISFFTSACSNNTQTKYYNLTNNATCCALTGISADCTVPADELLNCTTLIPYNYSQYSSYMPSSIVRNIDMDSTAGILLLIFVFGIIIALTIYAEYVKIPAMFMLNGVLGFFFGWFMYVAVSWVIGIILIFFSIGIMIRGIAVYKS